MSGRLVGIGVGPGDPELVTLKAVRRVSEADVVVALAAGQRSSRARAIVAEHIRPGTRERTVSLTMGPDRGEAEASYDRLAEAVRTELENGAVVAVLCEGDPLLFGTFIHLLERVGTTAEVEVVPGIASPIAAAAAELRPLAVGRQSFGVLPATMAETELKAALKTLTNAAIVKVGRHLDKVRSVLAELDLLDDARLVVELGGAGERRLPLVDWDEARAPYFSLVLSRGAGPSDAG